MNELDIYSYFELYPKQREVIDRMESRVNILDGSVRSGKTHGGNAWWVKEVIRNKDNDHNLLMTGKTIKSLERNVLSEIAKKVPCKWSLYKKEATIMGRKCIIEGANDARAEDKIRGMTIASHYGDEVSLWPESYFKQSLARMSIEGAKLLGTTNPDSPKHWLMEDWIARKDELNLSHDTLYIDDNTFLPESYIEAIKKEYTGVWYKRFIESKWVAAEGVVYDMFDEGTHVVDRDNVPKCHRYWLAADYGTASVTAFLLLGQTKDGAIYVLDEYVWDARKKGRQKTDTELADDLYEFQKGISHTGVVCDPSAVSFMLQCSQRKQSIRTIPANNEVLEGIRNVSSLLSNNYLYICSNCTSLIDELHSYCWDETKQEQGVDKPLKQDDHSVDALRYGIRTKRKYWKKLLL